MNKWSDLHGEDGDVIPHRPSKNCKWCDNCQCWVDRSDFKRWSTDGVYIHWLCPGCDDDMEEPELNEE